VGSVVLKFTIGRMVDIYRGPSPDGPFTMVAGGEDDGEWVDDPVDNDTMVCYVVKAPGRVPSLPSDPTCTTPKLDPHPPHGVLILQQTAAGPPYMVRLVLDASDNPRQEEHPPFDGRLLTARDLQSGVAEMKISNRSDFEGAQWEPYAAEKMWPVNPDGQNRATVFVMYRDAAGNESEVIAGTATLDPSFVPPPEKTFLPNING
jgi:hypothetical protein